MSLRKRHIPYDILEDIKLGKVLPIKGIYWTIGNGVLSIFLSFFIPSPLFKLIVVLGALIGTFTIFAFDIPGNIKKFKSFRKAKKKTKSIYDFSGIDKIGTISKGKKKEIVFLESEKVEPWEVCPDNEKESRALKFSEDIMTAVNMGVDVSIYATCSSEDTKQLENRLKWLDRLSGGIKELENDRIEHHYKLSKFAIDTNYITRIDRDLDKTNDDEIENIEDALIFDGVVMGEDLIKEYINNHLTPDSRLKRGDDIDD